MGIMNWSTISESEQLGKPFVLVNQSTIGESQPLDQTFLIVNHYQETSN